MLMKRNGPIRTLLPWLVVASIAAGCGDARPVAPELAPPDLDASKAALVASLDAWKADRRGSGIVIGSAPAVGIVDSMRADRPLLGYEVVGALMVADKARPFAVRLVLDAPRETISTRYVVLGRHPLWVFRQEDFERMLHWEHKMDGETGTDSAGLSARAK